MALTDYCSFDEIRAALGVNDDELEDAVLALPVYEIGLARELRKISASLPAAFSAANNQDGVPSEAAQALIDAVRLFAVYTVAKQAGAPLAMFAPKDIGDGKATLSRFAGEPYTKTLEAVDAAQADARSAVVDALAGYEGTTSKASGVATFFMASTRNVDRVTGA